MAKARWSRTSWRSSDRWILCWERLIDRLERKRLACSLREMPSKSVLTIPEIGLIALTRVALGAGLGLLLSGKLTAVPVGPRVWPWLP